jgi:hypothetical protein
MEVLVGLRICRMKKKYKSLYSLHGSAPKESKQGAGRSRESGIHMCEPEVYPEMYSCQ